VQLIRHWEAASRCSNKTEQKNEFEIARLTILLIVYHLDGKIRWLRMPSPVLRSGEACDRRLAEFFALCCKPSVCDF